jgi:hypothetical protein
VSSSGAIAEDTPVEFADGQRPVPAYIVAHLGGPEALGRQAAGLRLITYESFIKAFNEEVERDRLNQLQSAFVAGHFQRLRHRRL